MGIDGKEIADQLARESSSHPITGPQPAPGIYAKVARGVIRDWTHRKHEEHWQSICGQRQGKAFFKKPLCEKSWGTAQSEQKQAKNNDRVAKRTLSFKRTFI